MLKLIVPVWHNQANNMADRKCLFDRKFGSDFIKSVPLAAGVYEILDESGLTIYVGKAKRLRRRLQQYRNARRCKKHHKMRAILGDAISIRLTPCLDDLEAQLLENQLIQTLRPRFNVAGAFSFLYPVIGTRIEGSTLYLSLTTTPSSFGSFELYGAYRSRFITRSAYFGILGLLGYIGHREPKQRLGQMPVVKHSHVAGFRQISERWVTLLDSFLSGSSRAFLEEAVTVLLEKPMARRSAEDVQEWLDDLKRFYKFESVPLRKALLANGISERRISQIERDRLFIKSRETKRGADFKVSLVRVDR